MGADVGAAVRDLGRVVDRAPTPPARQIVPTAVAPGGVPAGPAAGAPAPGWAEARASGQRAGEGVSAAVDRLARRVLERLLVESQRRLRYRVHEETGRIWVQIIDRRTNEVLREIPPERYLDLVARIWELVGLLVDERA